MSIILISICQAASLYLIAQADSYLEGIVYNSETSEPISFATISLNKNEQSIYTNEKGNFRIIRSSDFQTDSLRITCFGYKKRSIAFNDLYYGEINEINLTPSMAGEEKVMVTTTNAKLNSNAIIRRAIGNLNSWYPVVPFNYVSYYRDYQKKDSIYINLNEAIIQTIDSGFKSGYLSNVYSILDFRKNLNFPRMDFFPTNSGSDYPDLEFTDNLIPNNIRRDQYGNELLTLMTYDPVRNFNSRSFSFIESFYKNFIFNHNFSTPSVVTNDNLVFYKIIFNGKTTVIGDSNLVSGAIYIQPEHFTIHKLEYSCYKHTKEKGLKRVFRLDLEYGNYNKSNAMMCLKYISFNRLFNVIDARDNSFFGLMDSHWDLSSFINPTLSLTFNNKVDPVTASKKENYTVKLGRKEIKIKSIQVVDKNIFIRFRTEDIDNMIDSFQVNVEILKDIDGNILNKRKSQEIYQYRELFVQEFNKPVTSKDNQAVQNISPVKDTLPIPRRKEYWMNTPLIGSENNMKAHLIK